MNWKKVKEVVIYILLYIWQLPQNIFALVFILLSRGEKVILKQKYTRFYIAPTMNGGISLGNYIFLSKKSGLKEPIYDHEFGHCIQSRLLGPLYLPIIGICSGIHALTYNGEGNYHDFWTERWANKLGGVPGYKGESHFYKEGVIHTVYKELLNKYKKFKF